MSRNLAFGIGTWGSNKSDYVMDFSIWARDWARVWVRFRLRLGSN